MQIESKISIRHWVCQLVWIECAMATLLTVACNSTSPHRPTDRQFHDPKRIATDLFEGRYTFPYAASDKKLRRVLNMLDRLEPGQSIDQVADLAGSPDYCRTWGPKVYPAKGLDLVYFLYKERDPALKEGVDVVVYLKFDLDGRLVKMPPVKPEELKQRLSSRMKNAATPSL